MFDRSRILTVVATVALALGAGHFVQDATQADDGQATGPDVESAAFVPLPTRPGSAVLLSTRRPSAAPQPTVASRVLDVPQPPSVALAGFSLPSVPLMKVVPPRDLAKRPPSDAEIDLDGFGMACGVGIDARPAPGGMIRLTAHAACDPGAITEVAHGAILFRAALGPAGKLTLDIPAIRSDASVRVTIGSADPIERRVQVPDAALYDRVALVGQDAATMSIHALEFGAGAGSEGHVSATRPQDLSASGGTVVRLGDAELAEPRVAEIYSFPTGRDPREGTVRLSVAARVTDNNCGGTARVRSVHATGGGVPPRIADLSVPMPDCDAVGRIMVLKNLVEDLKIARN